MDMKRLAAGESERVVNYLANVNTQLAGVKDQVGKQLKAYQAQLTGLSETQV